MDIRIEKEQQIERKKGNNLNSHHQMCLSFDASSVNEAFARIVVAAFVAPLNPTLEEISDIKTAVSEAVTNAIIHGYDSEYQSRRQEGLTGEELGAQNEKSNLVELNCLLEGDVLHVEIRDEGKGIEDIEQAMEPLFTTKPEMDRSGMGFAFMEAFMDDLEVISKPQCGTTIRMKKKLGITSWLRFEE